MVETALPFDLDLEIAKFRYFAKSNSSCGEVQMVAPDILKFSPKSSSTKKMKIGFLSMIHGNETIGLPILNTLLSQLLLGVISSDFEIFFGLGNIPAAYADKRFLQKDLNRCFGQLHTETAEDQRAREIEKYLLNEVDYLIDLHQTVQHTMNPFFIFQYSSQNCFSHLALMNSMFPTILQFDAIGDNQSFLSTDEYLRSRGRFGVALELGQIGLTNEKFETGLIVCRDFINKLKSYENFENINKPFIGKINFPLFEIKERLLATENESVLDERWSNFARFQKGQVLGSSIKGAIVAPIDGSVLFPKLNQKLSIGQNLFFICTEIHPQQLAIVDSIIESTLSL